MSPLLTGLSQMSSPAGCQGASRLPRALSESTTYLVQTGVWVGERGIPDAMRASAVPGVSLARIRLPLREEHGLGHHTPPWRLQNVL